jgi:thiamine biosynthesis lipoprotein
MGTLVSITVVDHNRRQAERAVEAAFMEIARIDGLLSHFRADSKVSRLNREKVLHDPSADLAANIRRSLYYGRLSGGAFDITVQPLLELYEHAFVELKRPPTGEEIRTALRSVDYRRIVLDGGTLAIGADQKITLGGIAKGYAVDRAMEVLRKQGVRNALVDAGGDLGTMGRYQGREWFVALRNPRDRDDYITRIAVSGKAVVTSGDYERYYDEEKSFHHIVDPRTGYSATELISVTVVAGTAFDADAVSTSVFVLGEKAGLRLIESLEGVEGLLIARDRRIIRSSGWGSYEL